VKRTPLSRYLLYLFCGLVFFYLLLPIFIVVPLSFSSAKYMTFPPPGWSLQWYERYFHVRQWTEATLTSMQVALATTLLATILGTLASLALVRYSFRGKTLINAIIMAPMIMPIIITAIAVYGVYVDLQLIGSKFGLILAHTVLAIPIVVTTVTATLRGFDRSLEHAAAVMGAGPIRTFFRVTLPIIQPGVLSGAIFAFITSFDEVVVTLFIAGSTAITLPKQMWDGIRQDVDPTNAAVSSLLIALSVILLLFSNWMVQRQQRLQTAAGTADDLPAGPPDDSSSQRVDRAPA
jgi:putative spermidine/putrescine transport system permease protein